jgi:phosphate transport system permease protein
LATAEEETLAPKRAEDQVSETLFERLKAFSSDDLFEFLTTSLGSLVLVILVVTSVVLARGSLDVFGKFGLGFLTGTDWNAILGSEAYGALPYILGTLVTAGIAISVGILFSLGIAIFLAEMAPGFLRAPLSQVIELLAAVPSVIYGFWGLFVFRFWVRDYLETPLSTYLGWIPAFHGTATGYDILTAGLILSIMIIPTVSSVSKETMMAVPSSQREAAYSIGATRWEVVKLGVLRYGRSGIFGAAILGLGRAVGETMAVTMVIGGTPGPYVLPTSLLKGGVTLSSLIATEFGEATGLHLSALFGLGLVLFLFALVINVFARLMVWRVFKVTGGIGE